MRSQIHLQTRDWRTESAFSEQINDFDINFGRLRTWAKPFSVMIAAITFLTCLLLSLGCIIDTIAVDPLRPSLTFYPSPASNNLPPSLATTKEAYVLFLPSVKREEYLLSLRVLLYGFKHDSETRDTRDVVVMTTPQVPVHIENQLRDEGAIIFQHDLITSIPNPHDPNGDHRWKDQFNKLLIWNMTQYERVLLLDSDMLMARSLRDIWKSDIARPSSGLTAGYQGDEADDYLNAGFMIAVPNRTMFEELLLVRDFHMQIDDIEQGLLNKYFARDGPHPWVALSRNTIWIATGPTKEDLKRGVHMLHEKCWMSHWDWELTSLWRTKLGKMLGYWEAREEIKLAAKRLAP